VLESAREIGARSFLDLYGGAGNFTLPLLSLGLTGTLVEVNLAAVLRAKQAGLEQGLGGATFRAEPVLSAVRKLVAEGHQADLVILDPPRAGALEALAPAFELARSRVVLIGCDPTAFARDLRFLLDLGGVLRAVIPFDMFSGTHHVELLGIVDKPGAPV
jgi:23S rRNA (uracil1939-C5)-methyltransferase